LQYIKQLEEIVYIYYWWAYTY